MRPSSRAWSWSIRKDEDSEEGTRSAEEEVLTLSKNDFAAVAALGAVDFLRFEEGLTLEGRLCGSSAEMASRSSFREDSSGLATIEASASMEEG